MKNMRKKIRATKRTKIVCSSVITTLLCTALGSQPIFAATTAGSDWEHYGNAAQQFVDSYTNVDNAVDFPNDQVIGNSTSIKGIQNGNTDVHRVVFQNQLIYCDTLTKKFNLLGEENNVNIPYGEDAIGWVSGDVTNSNGWQFKGFKTSTSDRSSNYITTDIVSDTSNSDYYAVYDRNYTATFNCTPADNNDFTVPSQINITESWNGVNKWCTGGSSDTSPQFTIPSFTGVKPTHGGLEATGFIDDLDNYYSFGDTYTFTEDHRTAEFTLCYEIVDTYTATFKGFDDDVVAVKKVYKFTNPKTNAIRYADESGNSLTGLTLSMPAIPANAAVRDGVSYTMLLPDTTLPKVWDPFSHSYVYQRVEVPGYTYVAWTNNKGANGSNYKEGDAFTFGSNKDETFVICGQIVRKVTQNWEVSVNHATNFILTHEYVPGMYGDSYQLLTWYGVLEDGTEELIGGSVICGQYGTNSGTWSSLFGYNPGWASEKYIYTDLTKYVKLKGYCNNAYFHSSISASSCDIIFTIVFN